MKRLLTISLVLIFVSCSNKISQEDLKSLNGYWEIEKVTFSNGQSKEYEVSTTVDYIKINELSGFRKKVYPSIDGSFDTTNDAEMFTITKSGDIFEISYSNEMSSWSEQLLTLEKESFSVLNKDNITYYYKRFKPIKLSL